MLSTPSILPKGWRESCFIQGRTGGVEITHRRFARLLCIFFLSPEELS